MYPGYKWAGILYEVIHRDHQRALRMAHTVYSA